MNAETQSLWYRLSIDADLAATRCDYCHQFGHPAEACPRLEHLVETGVTLQSTETDRSFNVALEVLFFVLGTSAGVALTKIVEAFTR